MQTRRELSVFTLFSFVLQLVHCNSNLDSLFYGLLPENEAFVDISCESMDKEVRMQPLHFKCSFHINGNYHSFHLRKINPVRFSLPIYSFDGKDLTLEPETIQEDRYYQNDDNTMTVMVNNINQRFSLRGTYVFGRRVYMIQPTETLASGNIHRIFNVHSKDKKEPKVLTKNEEGYRGMNRRSIEDLSDVTSQMHTVEVLVWIDYRMYSYVKTNLTKISNVSTTASLQEYIGFLFDSSNIPYRRLTQSGLHINIKPVAMIISTSPAASTWTEKNRIPSPTKDEAINITKTLHSFETYIDSHTNLPSHDHAMLFTYYEVEDNDELSDNETHVTGIATLSAMCKKKSASVISDQLDFDTVFTVAHEIGHGLGAEHDGTHNTCLEKMGYVMTPVIKRNTTHEWIFSSCSIRYFKNLISNLNIHNNNCLIRNTNLKSNVLDSYLREWYGQVYTPDQQCQLQYGSNSFFDRSDFNFSGSYQTKFCLQMDCYDETIDSYYKSLPGDGTPCGANKWCMAGECIHSPSVPSNVQDSCPNGNGPDFLIHDYWANDTDIWKQDWTKSCHAYISARPEHCYDNYVRAICCADCRNITASYPKGLPQEVYHNVPSVYDQCTSLFGSPYTFCKYSDTYNVSFEPVCNELRCKNIDDVCHETYAANGTPCGKRKWCVVGKCVYDKNAPDLPADCLFGDNAHYTRYNMHCEQLIKSRPQDCYDSHVKERCCKSCADVGSSPIDYTKVPSPDDQCKGIYGQQSSFCQSVSDYGTNFHSMCGKMYCEKPGTDLCYSTQAADGTACGHKRVCFRGNCTYSVNGPNYRDDCIFPNENSWCEQNIVSKETAYKCTFGHNADVCCFNCQKYVNTSMPANCQYGDMGNYRLYHKHCKDIIPLAPQECYDAKTRNNCCESCYNIHKFDTNNPGNIPTEDHQCQQIYGPTSRFCPHVSVYSTNLAKKCQSLYCTKPGGNLCYGIMAADGTKCGTNKWCVGGTCVRKQ